MFTIRLMIFPYVILQRCLIKKMGCVPNQKEGFYLFYRINIEKTNIEKT